MADESRLVNEGTALRGEEYRRRNCVDQTRDSADLGRWVVLDEAGWDGDQLYGGGRSRYLIIGSVALSDADAAGIVQELRRALRVQSLELKFSKSFAAADYGYRRQALNELLGAGGPLAERASVYVMDKHYIVVAKLIDLFVEEQAHAAGVDIRNTGQAREMARILFREGPRALGSDGFTRLLGTAVAFASNRNRHGENVTVEEFFEAVDAAWVRSHRRNVTEILQALRSTRREASSYVGGLKAGVLTESLEPLIPGTFAVARGWSHRIGKISVLIDDQRALTDGQLDIIHTDLSGTGYPEFRYIAARVKIGELVRGKSEDHPSLQLADLVAGAGFAVAQRHAGQGTVAGDDLCAAVIPLIDRSSALPHDEPERLAQVTPSAWS